MNANETSAIGPEWCLAPASVRAHDLILHGPHWVWDVLLLTAVASMRGTREHRGGAPTVRAKTAVIVTDNGSIMKSCGTTTTTALQ